MTDSPAGDSKDAIIQELASQAQSCVACALAKTRTNVVFGEGNPDGPMMVIGEGPGQKEDETGRPFVGRAGILLDACLKENSITRKHIYICNVVRCRACNHEGGKVFNRVPLPEEIEACSKWLDRTVSTIRPLVIVCLGAPSASSIIHEGFRMGAERGKWFESRFGIAAIASWHPAYILRQAGSGYDKSRQELVNDIGEARRKVIELKRASR